MGSPETTQKCSMFIEERGWIWCWGQRSSSALFGEVSCADGTNVVRVFREAISLAIKNKEHPPDEVLASHLQISVDFKNEGGPILIYAP